MAKINNKPASAYAKPHSNPTLAGRPVSSGEKTKATRVAGPQPSTVKVEPAGVTKNNNKFNKDTNVTVGNRRSNDYPETKTDGIKIRGTGAATKGLMARGPMA